MTYSRYRNDPHWITVRFPSACGGCDKPVHKGERAFYYPASRTVYGDACGCARQQSAEFDGAAFDDDNNRCL